MQDTIILYPNIGRGHLVSMVELGKLILTHQPSFSITILILTPPTTNTDNTITTTTTTTTALESNAQYIASVAATIPAIKFHHIPAPPAFSNPSSARTPPHLLSVELSVHSAQNVAVALKSLTKTSNIKAIIMDFMNLNDPKILTQNLNTNVPIYYYYTSGAFTLAVMLLFHLTLNESVAKNKPSEIQIPGLPTMSIDDFPNEGIDPSSQSYQIFLQIAKNVKGSIGIIINTFEAIEENAIKVLTDDKTVPPLYCIGPVISAPYGEEDKGGCLSWLDSQPSQSVVLLCFGSMGRFSRSQIKEIAIGLEKNKQRFLWVVRTELSESDSDEHELSLDELMPEGFFERTKEKGLVVREWAPQAEILSHDSVGGFVTHCGWNSVLEAVCEGVPMVTWPLYAEQKLNRFVLVNEMKVALALKENKDGFVSSTELGDRVKELMESDKGKDIRQRIFKMKISAKEARQEGGTSRVALEKLAMLWKQS